MAHARKSDFVLLRLKCDGTCAETRFLLLRLKCDGTCAEIRFRLIAFEMWWHMSRIQISVRNGRVHLNRQGASVQSNTGSRDVHISGSNAGYTMFRGSVKSTGYPLHSPVSPSIPLHVRCRVPSHFNWTLNRAYPFTIPLCVSRCSSVGIATGYGLDGPLRTRYFTPFVLRLRLKCDGTCAETRFRLTAFEM